MASFPNTSHGAFIHDKKYIQNDTGKEKEKNPIHDSAYIILCFVELGVK